MKKLIIGIISLSIVSFSTFSFADSHDCIALQNNGSRTVSFGILGSFKDVQPGQTVTCSLCATISEAMVIWPEGRFYREFTLISNTLPNDTLIKWHGNGYSLEKTHVRC